VREICDRHGILLMVDEVQTGMGRTGRMFACEHAGITPDVLTVAKGLGGGVMPLGAFIARPPLWEKMAADPFLHSSTMGGNQAACAAGVATIQTILEEGLLPRAVELGDLLLADLRRVQQRYPRLVRDVRGKGLLVGVELENADVALMVAAWSLGRGLIVYFSLNNPTVLRLAPPLVVTPEQIAAGVERLDGALADVAGLLVEAEAQAELSS